MHIVNTRNCEMYKYVFKRIFDFIIAAALIAILSPVFFIIGLLTFIFMGSTFFKQERGGYKGQVFKIYKFKTMTNKRGPAGEPLPDEERLTAFGHFLRRWSIDELPGLFNILKGEMSLVGPRPLVKQHLPTYTAEQFRRHDVMPGITGLAQVKGRNAIDLDQKLAWDTWYVDNISFLLDLKILFLTPKKIIKADDLNGVGQEVSKAFDLY